MIEFIFILALFASAGVASTRSERARRERPSGLRSPLVAPPCCLPQRPAKTWIIFVLSMAWVRKIQIPPCYFRAAGTNPRQARLAPSLLGALLRCRRTQAEGTR